MSLDLIEMDDIKYSKDGKYIQAEDALCDGVYACPEFTGFELATWICADLGICHDDYNQGVLSLATFAIGEGLIVQDGNTGQKYKIEMRAVPIP